MCRDRSTATHSPPHVRKHSTHRPTPFSTASSGGSGQVSEAEAERSRRRWRAAWIPSADCFPRLDRIEQCES